MLAIHGLKEGERVRRSLQPGTIGRLTGECQERAERVLVEVELPDLNRSWWVLSSLEKVVIQERPQEAFRNGRFGGVEDLRRLLTFEKLKGNLTDVFYSMNTSDTEFLPHQYKPVLKFIESTTSRLLIADEVGLGKTIEAMLIWKELEAREQARRLLIVCPSVLREKWRRELNRRFGVEARLADAAALREALELSATNSTASFALVAAMEGIRPSLEMGARPKTPSARDWVQRILEDHDGAAEAPLIDLVVVDEAHYARNPATATNRLVRLLDAAAGAAIFLSATPIQLNEDNLYQLLRLVDPGRFGDAEVFRKLIESNETIVAAARSLLSVPYDPVAARDALRAASRRSPGDALIARALSDLDAGLAGEPSGRMALAMMVERASVLAPAMVRTRKRDVLVNRVVRKAVTLKVSLTSEERAAYEAVTEAVRSLAGAMPDSNKLRKFAAIMRQRQVASSIHGWSEEMDAEEATQALVEDYGEQADGEGLAMPVLPKLPRKPAGAKDSKYQALEDFLRQRLKDRPRGKIVLFSFFRGTLAMLHRRLSGLLPSYVLQGGMGAAKDDVLDAFHDHEGAAILLSSEVGSEGLDLQYCDTLVNYDLPWNPMRLEQRIGRIDRIGQGSESILIVNLVLQDTIEDIILHRLHERLGIFERSLGDLEPILGPAVSELVLDLFRDGLSDEERRRTADQNINVLCNKVLAHQQLEEKATLLHAHGEYILESIKEGRELGRFVEPEALWWFVTDVLARHYPGMTREAVQGEPLTWKVWLSPEAKHDLGQFLAANPTGRRTRLHEVGAQCHVTVDPRWGGKLRPRPELVDASHPLVLWLRKLVGDQPNSVHPVSRTVLQAKEAALPAGTYVYLVDRWSFRGLRKENVLRHFARTAGGARLETREAERLVLSASHSGATLPGFTGPEAGRVLGMVSADAATGFDEASDRFDAENASLCARQADAVRTRYGRQIAEMEARLDHLRTGEAKARKAEPMMAARLAKTRERLAMEERDLSQKCKSVIDRFEVGCGIVEVV